MKSFSHTSTYRLLRSLSPNLRKYSTTTSRFQPTLASPSKVNPTPKASTSATKPAHEWTEADATVSEEDVIADRDAITAELHSAKVQREIAAFGDGGWKKADWAD